MTPQEMIEKVLDLSTADDVVVIVDESSSANLRFAGNTLTTNGVSRSSQLTVISIVGRGVGVVSRAWSEELQSGSRSSCLFPLVFSLAQRQRIEVSG